MVFILLNSCTCRALTSTRHIRSWLPPTPPPLTLLVSFVFVIFSVSVFFLFAVSFISVWIVNCYFHMHLCFSCLVFTSHSCIFSFIPVFLFCVPSCSLCLSVSSFLSWSSLSRFPRLSCSCLFCFSLLVCRCLVSVVFSLREFVS